MSDGTLPIILSTQRTDFFATDKGSYSELFTCVRPFAKMGDNGWTVLHKHYELMRDFRMALCLTAIVS